MFIRLPLRYFVMWQKLGPPARRSYTTGMARYWQFGRLVFGRDHG